MLSTVPSTYAVLNDQLLLQSWEILIIKTIVWTLAPAMHGTGSQCKGGKFVSQTQLKTSGEDTVGVMKMPLGCAFGHTAACRRENPPTLTWSCFLLLYILYEGKEHNTESLSCFGVFLKLRGNIPPFKNNLLWGEWSLSHKLSFYL